MSNIPKGLPLRVPSLTVGQTVLFGGSIVAASLGGFYWNLHRMQRKKAERGDLPYYEYLLAHVASRGAANPVPGAIELPLSRHQSRGVVIPPPLKEHYSGHSTVANFQPSTKSDRIRGRLEQPTPQRAKKPGSSVAYTKSPDYVNSYEKTTPPKLKNTPPMVEKTDVPELYD
ncbi:hypothetical protein E4T56_gene12230 [Termitomyces sp. T112]|nr:hypothetical protein E4T56_gene12230 [Termitomyces sp. T112]